MNIQDLNFVAPEISNKDTQPDLNLVNPLNFYQGSAKLENVKSDKEPFDWKSDLASFASKNVSTGARETYYNSKQYEKYHNSLFGKPIFKDPSYYDNEELNAEKQGFLGSLLNGTVKMSGAFVNSFVQTFNPVGYDNKVNNSLADLSEKMEIWFPNYYSKDERENPLAIRNIASGNFIGDKLIKNLGFMGGAITAALAQDAIITFATGGTGTAPLLTLQLGKGANWLSKLFESSAIANKLVAAEKVEKFLAPTIFKGEKALQYFNNMTKGQKILTGAKSTFLLAAASHGEASIEALEGVRSLNQELIKDFINKNGREPNGQELNQIQQLTSEAGNIRYGLNFATIFLTDAIQFSSLFKPLRAFTTGNTLLEGIGRNADDLILDSAGQLARRQLTKPQKIVGALTGDLMRSNISESAQEGLQYSFDKATNSFAHKKWADPKFRGSLGDYLNEQTEGLRRMVNDNEGRESMLLGFLTGFVAHGLTKGVNRIKGTNQNITERQNQIIEQFNGIDFNSMFQNPAFEELLKRDAETFNGRTNQEIIVQQMQQAIEDKNIFAYKGLQHEMLYNSIKTANSLGKFDAFIEKLDSMKQLPDEEFTKVFGVQINDSQTVEDYVDNVKEKAQEIKEIIEAVDNNLPNPFSFKEQNTEWTAFNDMKVNTSFYLSSIENITGRIDSVTSDLLDKNPSLTEDLIDKMSDTQNFSKKFLEPINEERKQLAESVQLMSEMKEGRDENLFQQAKDELKSLDSHITNLNQHLEAFKTKSKDLTPEQTLAYKGMILSVLKYNHEKLTGKPFSFTETQLQDTLAGLIDFQKLKSSLNLTITESNKLQTPEGKAKFIKEHINFLDRYSNAFSEMIKDINFSNLKKYQDQHSNSIKNEIQNNLIRVEQINTELQSLNEQLQATEEKEPIQKQIDELKAEKDQLLNENSDLSTTISDLEKGEKTKDILTPEEVIQEEQKVEPEVIEVKAIEPVVTTTTEIIQQPIEESISAIDKKDFNGRLLFLRTTDNTQTDGTGRTERFQSFLEAFIQPNGLDQTQNLNNWLEKNNYQFSIIRPIDEMFNDRVLHEKYKDLSNDKKSVVLALTDQNGQPVKFEGEFLVEVMPTRQAKTTWSKELQVIHEREYQKLQNIKNDIINDKAQFFKVNITNVDDGLFSFMTIDGKAIKKPFQLTSKELSNDNVTLFVNSSNETINRGKFQLNPGKLYLQVNNNNNEALIFFPIQLGKFSNSKLADQTFTNLEYLFKNYETLNEENKSILQEFNNFLSTILYDGKRITSKDGLDIKIDFNVTGENPFFKIQNKNQTLVYNLSNRTNQLSNFKKFLQGLDINDRTLNKNEEISIPNISNNTIKSISYSDFLTTYAQLTIPYQIDLSKGFDRVRQAVYFNVEDTQNSLFESQPVSLQNKPESQSIDLQKADIERRRKEELNSVERRDDDGGWEYKLPKERLWSPTRENIDRQINAKYDAELAALEQPVQETAQPKEITVKKDAKSDWTLIVNPDGVVINKNNGEPIGSKSLINQAHLKSGFVKYEKITASNKKDYAYTEDGRVISLNKSSLGDELDTLNSSIAKNVISKSTKFKTETPSTDSVEGTENISLTQEVPVIDRNKYENKFVIDDEDILKSSKNQPLIQSLNVTETDIENVKRLLPTANIQNLFEVANSDAWATFQQSGITLYKGATRADLYHEAWHHFSQFYLTKEEKIKLYNETRDRVAELKDKTDLEVEEYTAREFSKFTETGKIEGKYPERKSIFQKIWDFLKSMFEKDLSFDTLFNQLYKGQVNPLSYSTDNLMFGKLNSDINSNFSAIESDFIMKGLNTLFIQVLQGGKKSETQMNDVSIDKVYKVIGKYINAEFKKADNNRALKLEKILDNWDEVKKFHFSKSPLFNKLQDEFELDENGETISKQQNEDDKKGRNTADFQEQSEKTIYDIMDSEVSSLIRNLTDLNPDGTEVVDPIFGLPKSVDFSKYVEILKESFDNFQDFNEMISKIEGLQSKYPAMKELKDRLFINESNEVKMLRIKFVSSLGLVKKELIEGLLKESGIVVAQKAESSKKRQAENDIITFFYQSPETQFIKKVNGENLITPDKINLITSFDTIKSEESKVQLLRELGIQIDNILPLLNSKERKELFNDNTFTYLKKHLIDYLTKVGNINSIIDALKTKIDGKFESKIFTNLVRLNQKYIDQYISGARLNAEGKLEQEKTQWATLDKDIIALDKAKSIQELSLNPNYTFLKGFLSNEQFLDLKSSVLLSYLFNLDGSRNSNKIIISNYNGLGAEDLSKDGLKTKDLFNKDKVILDISLFANDNRLTTMQLSNKASHLSFQFDKPLIETETEFIDKMFNYLLDELEIIKRFDSGDTELTKLKKLSSAIKKGDSYNLAIFKDIINGDLKDKVINSYLENSNIDSLKDEVLKTIKQFSKDELQDTIKYIGSENLANIKTDSKRFPASADRSLVVQSYLQNQLIFNIELSKITFGNPYMHTDPFKRIAGATSGGRSMLSNELFLQYLKEMTTSTQRSKTLDLLNKKLGVEYKLQKRNSEDEVRHIIFRDREKPSDYYGEILNALEAEKEISKSNPARMAELEEKEKSIKKAYQDVNGSDAMAACTIDFWRKSAILSGRWDFNKLEPLYQKIINWDYYNRLLKNEPENLEYFTKREENNITDEELINISILKYQYYGNIKNNSIAEKAFHKFQLMPLIPQVIEGKNWSNHLDRMIYEDIDYALFDSASKLEKDNTLDEFYKEDSNATNLIDDYKYFYQDGTNSYNIKTGYLQNLKEQVFMENGTDSSLLFGSQMRKLLFNNDDFSDLYSEFASTIQSLTDIEKEKLQKLSGLNSKGEVTDNQQFVNFLLDEVDKKTVNQNVKEYLKLTNENKFVHSLDTNIQRQPIESIINSVINSRLVKQKMHGEMLVQVSSVGFEDIDTGKGLRFYTYKQGDTQVRKMEVKVPLTGKFKNLLNLTIDGEKVGTRQRLNQLIQQGKIDSRTLTMIGYRIPTQEHNSVEVMQVQEFIDPLLNAVIVPYEITTKAGSDFDIDKLNIFKPHIDSNGNYISPTNKQNKKAQFVDQLISNYNIYKDENISGRVAESNLINKLFEGVNSLDYTQEEIEEIKNELLNSGIEDKKELLEQLENIKESKESYQNKIIEIFEKVLLAPSNYINLITPNSTSMFDGAMDNIFEILYPNDSQIKKGKRVPKDLNYTQSLLPRNNWLTSKILFEAGSALGIAAVGNTFTQLIQKAKVNFTDTYLNNYNFIFPLEDISKRSLSNGLSKATAYSQLINIYVDIANDPRAGYVNIGDKVTPIVNSMINLGVPIDTILYFVNQPIIRDYVEFDKSLKDSLIFGRDKVNSYKEFMKEVSFSNKYDFGSWEDENKQKLNYKRFALPKQTTKEVTDKLIEEGINTGFDNKLLSFSIGKSINNFKEEDNRVKFSKQQLLLLSQYLQLAELSNDYRRLQSSMNFDTNLSKDGFDAHQREELFTQILMEDIFTNLPELKYNTVVSPLNISEQLLNLNRSLLPLVNSPTFYNFTNQVLEEQYKNKSNRFKQRFVRTFKNDFISYLYQNFLTKSEDGLFEFNQIFAPILNVKNLQIALKKQNIFNVNPIQSVDKKAIVKASLANKYIGFAEGIKGSSTDLYAKQAGKFANTGVYSSSDVIFVSVPGKRGTEQQQKEQQDKTIKEAINAIESGATLITDNKSYVDSNSYNTGEKRLAQNLQSKGYNYSEQTIDGQLLGVWTKDSKTANKDFTNKPNELGAYLLRNLFKEYVTLKENKQDVFDKYSILDRLFISSEKDIRNIGLSYFNKDSQLQDSFIDQFKDLLNHPDLEIRNFMLKFAYMSFYQSGLNKSFISSADLIPPIVFGSILDKVKEQYTKEIDNPQKEYSILKDFYNQFTQNNEQFRTGETRGKSNDNKLGVKSYRGKDLKSMKINKFIKKEEIVKEEPKGRFNFEYKGKSISTEFQLGEQQDKALKNLIDFINSNKDIITLQGSAGTGKTTIIGYLQKYLGNKFSFAYIAPTHAATAELAFATAKTGNTSLPSTLQSAITYSNPNKKFVFTQKITKKLSYNPVIVVDESSMIDKNDLNNLKEAINDIGGKLILLGDEKQISKVITENVSRKSVSPAFTDVDQVNLSKVFRQSDNSLLSLLTQMRNQTDFRLFKVANSESVKFLNRKDYNKELIEDLETNPENTVVISYTNNSVKGINASARRVLGRDGFAQKGDIVIGYLGYASKQIEKKDIANSILYTITDIAENGSVRNITATSQKLKDLMKLGISNLSEKATTSYYQLGNEDSLTFDLTQEDFKLNNKIVSDIFSGIHKANEDFKNSLINYPTYLGILQGYSETLRKVSVGNDYIYNPDTNQMERFDAIKHKNVKSNGQGSLLMNKDIDYGHAITIHKSQGSTIDNVYFDSQSLNSASNTPIVDKENNQITTEKQSLAYVAMSRSKNKLVVYEGDNVFSQIEDENNNNLPDKTCN